MNLHEIQRTSKLNINSLKINVKDVEQVFYKNFFCIGLTVHILLKIGDHADIIGSLAISFYTKNYSVIILIAMIFLVQFFKNTEQVFY